MLEEGGVMKGSYEREGGYEGMRVGVGGGIGEEGEG